MFPSNDGNYHIEPINCMLLAKTFTQTPGHPHINESFSDGCFLQNPSSCPIDSAILWGFSLIAQIEDGTSATTRALVFAFENNGFSNHSGVTLVF